MAQGLSGSALFFGGAGTEVAQERTPLTVESEMSGVGMSNSQGEDPENDERIAGCWNESNVACGI